MAFIIGKEKILFGEGSRDMTIDDLQEFSNIFASEFNNSDIHDRVLCFQIIENKEFEKKVGSKDNERRCESETLSNLRSGLVFTKEFPTENKDQTVKVKDNSCERTLKTSKDGNVCKL
jgi:hypothetical protein